MTAAEERAAFLRAHLQGDEDAVTGAWGQAISPDGLALLVHTAFVHDRGPVVRLRTRRHRLSQSNLPGMFWADGRLCAFAEPERGLSVASFGYSGWRPEPLPSPWVLVPGEQRAALESELTAEVSPRHPLSGYQRITIARCQDCDDVVFSVEADPARFVNVHLTWRGGAEQPPWPRTEDLGMPLSRSLAAHVH